MKKYGLLLACMLLFISCGKGQVTVEKVESPYKFNFELLQPKSTSSLRHFAPSHPTAFEDDSIAIGFGIIDPFINIWIGNKTDTEIKINLDDLAIIFPDGKSSKVLELHNYDKKNPQPPLVISPKGELGFDIVPIENTYSYSNLKGTGFGHLDLFKGKDKMIWNDKEFSVLFAMELNGSKKEYTFKFKIQVNKTSEQKVGR